MVGGTIFMLMAVIGLLRLPDLYTRMHAITKAGTLGIGLVLVSAAVAFGSVSVTTRSLLALLFVLVTVPVSDHMIGRAGYLGKVDQCEETVFDDWQADYDTLRREGEEEVVESAEDADETAAA